MLVRAARSFIPQAEIVYISARIWPSYLLHGDRMYEQCDGGVNIYFGKMSCAQFDAASPKASARMMDSVHGAQFRSFCVTRDAGEETKDIPQIVLTHTPMSATWQRLNYIALTVEKRLGGALRVRPLACY